MLNFLFLEKLKKRLNFVKFFLAFLAYISSKKDTYTMNWINIISLLLLCPINIVIAAKGSCREQKKCCDGKDSQCVVQEAGLNEIIEDYLEDEPCYCDHGCLDVGDCCPDFKDYCGGK